MTWWAYSLKLVTVFSNKLVKTRRFVTRGSERIADYVLSIFDCIPDNCWGYKSITAPDKDKIIFGIGYMYGIMYRNVYCLMLC